jgi:hypothetical protein
VVIFTPRPLYPQGNSLRYLFDRGWVGPREEQKMEEKNTEKIKEGFKMTIMEMH